MEDNPGPAPKLQEPKEDWLDMANVAAGVEQHAKEDFDDAYANARAYMDIVEKQYQELRGKPKFNSRDIINIVKNHWKSISVVAAAIGVPISISDPGAFASVAGLVAKLLPF